jgi:hypothetical protein
LPSTAIAEGFADSTFRSQVTVLASEFDVRFVYVHHPDWYLSIEAGRDAIERALANTIDLSGRDIRKALKLFRKSNPPLLEWLQCRAVYLERSAFASTLRTLLPRFFSPEASSYYYLHMARGNFREYLQGETVWRRKYLYVLRPLLATRWIARGHGPVPIEFQRRVDAPVSAGELRDAIEELVRAKIAGRELDEGPRITSAGNTPYRRPNSIDFSGARSEECGRTSPPSTSRRSSARFRGGNSPRDLQLRTR